MPQICWDASALVKRYTSETGTDTVNTILQSASRSDMAITPWGYLETHFILLKKRNSGTLSTTTFGNASAMLRAEVLGVPGFNLLTISDTLIFGSLSLMLAHNLNSADAAILTTFLEFSRASSEGCLLVASDKRLLRAATAEGLSVLNPEAIAAADVSAFLASL